MVVDTIQYTGGKLYFLVKGKLFHQVFLALFLTLTFRTFQYFPGMQVVKELWIVALVLFLVTAYTIKQVEKGLRFSSFELYVILMVVLIPLWSGLMAYREFGQPLVFGAFSVRNIVLSIGGLAVLYFLRLRWVTIKDFEAALVGLAWVSLSLYIFISTVFDPAQFASLGKGFVGGGNVSEASFKLNTLFIVFGFYYYIFQGFRFKLKRYYMYGLLFFGYLVFFEGGRSLMLSVIGGWLFFLWRWASISRLFLLAPKFLLVSMTLLVALLVVNPTGVLTMVGKFGDAFTVVATGEESEDASANARILETAIVLPYIQKHWLMGNGSLSHQWHDGYEEILGYFYPSDIGMIGVLYMYGVLGICLFLVQYYYAISLSKKLSLLRYTSPMLDASKGFLLYFLIHSLVTGLFVHYAEVSILFIALLYGMLLEEKKRVGSKVRYA